MINETMMDWVSFFQEFIYYCIIIQKVMLGGYEHAIEIDESKFGNYKASS